jgi:hypothetical protein
VQNEHNRPQIIFRLANDTPTSDSFPSIYAVIIAKSVQCPSSSQTRLRSPRGHWQTHIHLCQVIHHPGLYKVLIIEKLRK